MKILFSSMFYEELFRWTIDDSSIITGQISFSKENFVFSSNKMTNVFYHDEDCPNIKDLLYFIHRMKKLTGIDCEIIIFAKKGFLNELYHFQNEFNSAKYKKIFHQVPYQIISEFKQLRHLTHPMKFYLFHTNVAIRSTMDGNIISLGNNEIFLDSIDNSPRRFFSEITI